MGWVSEHQVSWYRNLSIIPPPLMNSTVGQK